MKPFEKALFASSITMLLLQPLVLLGVVVNPALVAVISWMSYLVDSVSVFYSVWQAIRKYKRK